MSPDWYQTHQLCNTSDDFCATLNCYRYGEEDRVQWNQFDYVNNDNGQMENFMPNTDFDFGELWRIILNEWYARNNSQGEIEERSAMDEDIVKLREENVNLREQNERLQMRNTNLLQASESQEEIEERRAMDEDIVNLRQENERLKLMLNSQLQEYLSNLASDGYLPSEHLDLVLRAGNELTVPQFNFVF